MKLEATKDVPAAKPSKSAAATNSTEWEISYSVIGGGHHSVCLGVLIRWAPRVAGFTPLGPSPLASVSTLIRRKRAYSPITVGSSAVAGSGPVESCGVTRSFLLLHEV